MPLTQLNLEGKTKTEVAIARIQEFVPPEGYWLAFRGLLAVVAVQAI